MVARPQEVLDPGSLSDREVVGRIRAGDLGLFEILMRRHNQRLFRVARGILGDAGEAEDVAQEAHVRAFRELASFRGDAAYATWLTRIAVHEAMARAKERRRLVAVDDPEPAADLRPADTDPGRRLENRELQAAIGRAVDALPAPLRAVFVLREVEGLSTQETAESLGLSAENVRVRLHRAKSALRESLDEAIGRETRRLYLFAGDRCDRLVERVFARLGGTLDVIPSAPC
ncbi:MAG TPA: RNA polymerase sigma factor [Thermoanaerobaculia bacterium]|nr:RNA polymerase sigma factor [Thermoanaerobaculia bacterium]